MFPSALIVGPPKADWLLAWTRCWLEKPSVRITTPGYDSIPFQDKDLEFCNAKSKTSVPAVVGWDQPILAEFLFDRRASGSLYVYGLLASLVSAANIDSTVNLQNDVSFKDVTRVVVPLMLPNFGLDKTWRPPMQFNGDINFTVVARFDGLEPANSAFFWPRAELYSLTTHLSSAFDKGVPRKFLSLFTWTMTQMLQSISRQSSEPRQQSDWITWVVKRCHASLCHAKQYGNYLDNLDFTPIHRYR